MIEFILYTADWCMPCQRMKPLLKEFASENADIKIQIINIESDTLPNLPLQIQGVPTLAVLKNNELVESVTGLHNKEMLKELMIKYED